MSKSKRMSLLCIFAVCILSITCLGVFAYPAETAHAAELEYIASIPTDGELIASSSPSMSDIEVTNGQDTFVIPRSYYMQIIEPIGSTMYKVSVPFCNKEFFVAYDDVNNKGYITDSVSFAGKEETMYPGTLLSLKEGVSVTLSKSGTAVTSADGYTIKYLGEGITDERTGEIYAVFQKSGQEDFAYIDKDNLLPFSLPYQEISAARRAQLLAEQEKPGVSDDGSMTPNTSKTLRIILIIGIVIPAVLIVAMLFKPSKNTESYDKRAMKRSRRRDEFDYDRSRRYSDEGRPDRRELRRDYDRGYDRSDRGYDRDRGDAYHDSYDRDRRDFRDRDDRY